MLYLLDACVLIDANRDYYPIDRVPEFWEWLADKGRKGQVKMPRPIFNEPKAGNDSAAAWLKRGGAGSVLYLDEETDAFLVSQVINEGYAQDLTEVEIGKVGNDPFLIAAALVDPTRRCVVTTENSKPKRQRANRKVPDVCRDFDIKALNTFQLIRELDFSTSWKA